MNDETLDANPTRIVMPFRRTRVGRAVRIQVRRRFPPKSLGYVWLRAEARRQRRCWVELAYEVIQRAVAS